MPVVRLAVVAEVAPDLAAAAQPRAVHDLDLHFVCKLGAQGVEIAGVEARDVGRKPLAIGLGQHRQRPVVGFGRSSTTNRLPVTAAATMQSYMVQM